MIFLTVYKHPSGIAYVSQSELINAILEEYGQEKADTIFSEFGKIMTPSTVPVISESPLEFRIYPHDLCAVAKQLQLSIQLLDSDGTLVRINDALSGIVR
ncbi:TPA: hypothetical protein NG675_000729 [Vibrio parahaemolyticus]|uniref:hypothetical protein n=1 Tax=Vibrio parahaemolyticus TaxID=670 RepID=UPI00193DB2E9|nr:hypothetical protein [Vibrio parahaemolyticus]MBM5028125.1 hypothetical protein [Vibrio parahaemolyticus]HCG5303029.1 hypothetical protein [Vibrio parahaemolyticus]HCG5307222.1 hypothetical protein [Vibrio parahaemolyticus]HCJ2788774.1 hypothetical protein [Vibrio parahaemolyticus]